MRKNNALRVLRKIAPWVLVTLFTFSSATVPSARASIGIVVTIAPEPLPVYVQPICPGPGFIWAPGYWAWGPDGYFWVPGTWVFAPFPGALWTPGYWAWDPDDAGYVWYEGYWGPVVGFYGGVVYGFGYTGVGYEGGYWQNGAFYYNRSVNNVSTTNITNVYNKTVVNNVTVNNVSYNGGNGGTTARPTAAEMTAARERRAGPTSDQRRQVEVARADPAQLVSANHGRPPVAATPKPGALKAPGVVRASGAGMPANPATGEAQPKGGFQPFHPNPKQSEKPARSVNPATPEMGNPRGKPEQPGRMEPAPRTQPATRDTQPQGKKPEKPQKEEKPNKSDKHQPPPEAGRSNVAVNRGVANQPSVRMENPPRDSGRFPMTARHEPTMPARNASQASAPERQGRTGREQPNSAHAPEKDQTKRHPPSGGR
jgi:YXWGXW repeat-containing protein